MLRKCLFLLLPKLFIVILVKFDCIIRIFDGLRKEGQATEVRMANRQRNMI